MIDHVIMINLENKFIINVQQISGIFGHANAPFSL